MNKLTENEVILQKQINRLENMSYTLFGLCITTSVVTVALMFEVFIGW